MEKRMEAYVIVDSKIKDHEKLAQYKKLAPDTVKKFGGEFIAKGETNNLNSVDHYPNKAIIKFPSKEIALSWYESSEYQSLISIRDEAMESRFDLI
jgi:uncharacterized protein (DUF1330 family)